MIANSSNKSIQKRTATRVWLGVVLAIAFLVRLVTLFLYQPVAYSDTPSYRRLADTILHGFADYDGTRTPGYPAFLALVGSDQKVWFVQLFLGLVTTLLLFYIGWKLTAKPWFGGLIALAHTLNLGQLFFESNLLTESLTTFLLVLTMAGVLYWFINPNKRTVWLAFPLGLVSTLTLFVRPMFIFLPFLALVVLWLAPATRNNAENARDEKILARSYQTRWQAGVAFLLPVVLLLGVWIGFIHDRFGDWSLTTMTGYHLVQHTGNFFEYVPDDYATLRDIYIQFRDAHIAQYGTQTNTIWEAIPAMSQASGYSFYALSRVLTRISIQLILEHPFLYQKSAISGWWMFWRTPVYWSPEALRFPWMVGIIQVAVLIERAILFVTNLVFIVASSGFAIFEGRAALRRDPSKRLIQFTHPAWYVYFWTLLGTVWIASIVQTLLDHGDNPRFLVPMQSLVVLWVAVFILQFASKKRAVINPQSKT